VTACGQCYYFTYQESLKWLLLPSRTRPKLTVVHGTLVNPWVRREIAHAWVESKGRVYDWQTVVARKASDVSPTVYEIWRPQRMTRYTSRSRTQHATLRSIRTLDMNARGYNGYVNWALYAILGRMAEADGIMEEYGPDIYEVVRHFQRRRAPTIRPLYRGVLVEAEHVVDGKLLPDDRVTFVSFSEERDVACWFADPESFVSGFVKQQRPRVQGFVIEHRPKLEDILFHYSWGLAFPLPDGRKVSLTIFAQMHPDIDIRQFDWNLRTQKEVILKPIRQPLVVRPKSAWQCPPAAELDARLLPPMFR
jgi:hypothetical protein